MTISKKRQNKKFKSKKLQYGGKDCKFPEIWENEIDGNECVKECPKGTCPKYNMAGKFKCIAGECSLNTPSIQTLETDVLKTSEDESYEGRRISLDYWNQIIYYGPLKLDKPDGIGLAIIPSDDMIYYGHWDNGKMNGRGTIIDSDETFVYDGDFKDNKFNGQGKMKSPRSRYWNTSFTYEGSFVNNEHHGMGKLISDNIIYEGEFENNEFLKGKKTEPDGSFQEGDFRNGELLNGKMKGTIEENGIRKEGIFDVIDSVGILKRGKITKQDGSFQKGDFTNGELLNGKMTGTIEENGIRKEGIFEVINSHQQKILKEGKITKQDGTEHEGIFEVINGVEILKEGKITKRDGTEHEGKFEVINGVEILKEGKITMKNGKVDEGIFEVNDSNKGMKERRINWQGVMVVEGKFEVIAIDGAQEKILKEGKITKQDGTVVEGIFEVINDKLRNRPELILKGKITRQDGTVDEGIFEYIFDFSLKEGKKTITNRDVTIEEEGKFQDGKLIEGQLRTTSEAIYYEVSVLPDFNLTSTVEGKIRRKDGYKYDGQLNSNLKPNGVGTLIQVDGTFVQGNFLDGKFLGYGKVVNSRFGIMRNYHDNHLFLTLDEYRKEQFIIPNPNYVKGSSITLLIILHGTDIENSVCHIADNSKHVRLISPVKTGCSNLSYADYDIMDMYNITKNVFHLQNNENASSVQKIKKSIELFNVKSSKDKDTIFSETSLFRPLMDHLYSYGEDLGKNAGIYVIYDTEVANKMINDFQEFQLGTNLFSMPINFFGKLLQPKPVLRSTLINNYLETYDTINIIDLSCRDRRSEEISDELRATLGTQESYSCVYNQASSTMPPEDVITSNQ